MKKIFLILSICFLSLGSSSAQSFIGKINPFPVVKANRIVDDSIKILAVMVNFQEDKDETTFGNGKFGTNYSKDYGTDIIDPLPHDKTYFESHLAFLKNYYQKASSGKTNIGFTVLPDTFSVSKTMRNYTPASNSDDFTPLAQFSEEVWTKADAMYPDFNFADYDVFLIFHAGVGRDISLPSSLGNEKDLPSVYLSDNALKNIYGETFDGFSVSDGSFKITNSMIIPETESRELEGYTESVLYEITINGLLVASVASYLGLPDLFNTETGLSAIGRFGLMDGQSIFAYNGVFPPQPSAWEKIYLGWTEPITLEQANYDVNLVTSLAAASTDSVIIKLPLNSTEYYLIENKQRDANKDGAIVTISSNGNIYTKTFLKDTTGFYSYDIDSLEGVILDVDEYDWALPGSGIIIWHIDQNVIDENLADNKINNDKSMRGVDVEEADGVQDIGETFTTILGDEVVGEGTGQDLWYAGNSARLYKNKFANDTRPNTKTNSGANSLITIKDFSVISNKMSFTIEYGDSVIKPLFVSELSNSDIDSATTTLVSMGESNQTRFAVLSSEGELLLNDFNSSVKDFPNFSNHKVVSLVTGTKSYVIVDYNSQINILSKEISASDEAFILNSVAVDKQITSPLVLRKTADNNYELLFGGLNGRIFIYDLQSIIDDNPIIQDSIAVISTNDYVFQVVTDGNDYSAITQNSSADGSYLGQYFDQYGNYEFNQEKPVCLAMTENTLGSLISVVLTSENNFYVFQNGSLISEFNLQSEQSIKYFAVGDIKNDGSNYIVVNDGKVKAFNLKGALAENFPFEDPNETLFEGTPIVADIEGDLKSEIISVTEDGRIFAIDGGTGKVISGFPISLGSYSSGSSAIFAYDDKLVYVAPSQSTLNGWMVSSVSGRIDWGGLFGDNFNGSFISTASATNVVNEFFPTTRAYNYPNPVYNGQTAIRYYVNEDSKVNIKIFDLAGGFVAELNDNASGGFDNEKIWNVGDIQSGVYLARIEAVGSSGKTESIIIKIAVVK